MKKEPLNVSIERFQIEAPKDDPTPKLLGEGAVDDLMWKVEGQTGTLEPFLDEGKPLPFQLKAVLWQQDLNVKSALGFADGTADFSVKAKGPDVEQIKKILRLTMGRLPNTSPSIPGWSRRASRSVISTSASARTKLVASLRSICVHVDRRSPALT